MAILVASCERKQAEVTEESSAEVSNQETSPEKPKNQDQEMITDEPEPDEEPDQPVLIEKKPPFAEPVPGQPGFVKSPYNGKIIDVKGIPAGSLVADPTYPAEEKKHFRVPEMPAVPVDGIETPAILDPSILINPSGAKPQPAPKQAPVEE